MPSLDSGLLSIVASLASAASWGAGDFTGGIATRRTPVYTVVFIAQLLGGALLLGLALAGAQALPSADNLWLGALAGLCGEGGLLALYSSLSRGRMGVVAPLAAVIAAALPVAFSLLGEGLPGPLRLAGFGVAFAAVWLLSAGGGGERMRLGELGLPVLAGVAFGLFFILIDHVSAASLLWPLVAARASSAVVLFALVVVRRSGLPARSQLAPIFLAGILDTGGNAFFALATRSGRLDVATVLSSLYPAITVLLAWRILKEKLARGQWIGVAAALLALALIAL